MMKREMKYFEVMKMSSKEYCMYLRKSRSDIEAEARGEGETLARHENILLELAKRLKLNVTKIYREIVSGETIANRPVVQHVLSEIELGLWKGVLVVEVERLARGDTIDQGIIAQTFKYSNTKIITPMKIYDPQNEFDEEYFEFGLFMSRREYKTINRRLQGGRVGSVMEGKYVGNIAPYGYVRKKLTDQKGYTLEPHDDQADTVRLIYRLYTKGDEQPDSTFKRLGVSLIVRKLNELKIPTMKKGDWVTSTIRDILSNPVYIGKIRWKSRPQVKKIVDGKMIKKRPRADKKDVILVDGMHEAIIDNVTFELAQKYLAENSSTPVPNALTVKNPLVGLIVCGKCGRKMNRRPHGNRYPDTLMCPVTSCDNISSKLAIVEDKLLQALEIWLKKYKLQYKEIKDEESNLAVDLIIKSIEKVDNDIDTLNKQLSSLHDFLEQGIYTTEVFLERSKVINEKISTASNDKKVLGEKLNQDHIREETQRILIPKVEKILELYNELGDPASKNRMLKEVISKVIYTKTVNGRWHGKPDDFELVLHMISPK